MPLKHKNRIVCFIGIVGTGIAVDSWRIFAKPNPIIASNSAKTGHRCHEDGKEPDSEPLGAKRSHVALEAILVDFSRIRRLGCPATDKMGFSFYERPVIHGLW